MSDRFYRLQQKIGITKPEAAAVSVLVMLFMFGAGVQGWRSVFMPVPVFDYTEVDSIFNDASKRLYSEIAGDSLSTVAMASASPAGSHAININTAGATELQRLPRIGPAIAGRIIEYRTTRGPFGKVDDLVRVAGIGPKTLENLRPLITVADADSSSVTSPSGS